MIMLAIYADNALHAHYAQNGEENIKLSLKHPNCHSIGKPTHAHF